MLNKFSLPNLPFFSLDYTAYSAVWNCERLHSCYIAGFLWKRTGWRHTLPIHVFCVGAYSRKTGNRKNNLLFWFGWKALSTGNCLSAITATRSEQLHVAIAHSSLKPTTRLICSVGFTQKPEGARCSCCYCRRVIFGLQLPTLQNNCCVVNLLSMVETHSTELVHSAAMHCVLAWSVLHIF